VAVVVRVRVVDLIPAGEDGGGHRRRQRGGGGARSHDLLRRIASRVGLGFAGLSGSGGRDPFGDAGLRCGTRRR